MLVTAFLAIFLFIQDEILIDEYEAEVQRAVQDFIEPKESIQLLPNSEWKRLQHNLERILNRKPSRENESLYLLVTGMEALTGARLTDAIAGFSRGIVFDPNQAPLFHYTIGLAYSLSKDYDKAESELQFAVRLWPHWARPHLTLAAIYMESGRPKDAETAIRTSLELSEYDKPKGRQLLMLAQLLAAEGRAEQAGAALQQAFRYDDADPLLYEHIGLYRLKTDGLADALAAWGAGLQVAPESSALQRNVHVAGNGFRIPEGEALALPVSARVKNSAAALPGGFFFTAFKLSGKAGGSFKIRADSDEFTPFLMLLSADGRLVAAQDIRSSHFSVLEYAFPDSGTFFLIVSTSAPEQTGQFELQ